MLETTQIKQLSEEADVLLASLATKYDIGPLSLSAIFLARLLAIHRECGTESDFQELVRTALSLKIEDPTYANYSRH